MNFTIEFFRTRPSDEAHATLDGFMGQDPAHQTSAPPPKEKNVRKKLDAATGEILQRRAGAKVQQIRAHHECGNHPPPQGCSTLYSESGKQQWITN